MLASAKELESNTGRNTVRPAVKPLQVYQLTMEGMKAEVVPGFQYSHSPVSRLEIPG